MMKNAFTARGMCVCVGGGLMWPHTMFILSILAYLNKFGYMCKQN